MSLKDLFKEQKYKYISNTNLSSLTASGVESPDYVKVFIEDRDRFIPLVDYSKPENFAKFGSAEKYYYDSITRVYETYPYDGSKKEKILWELSSSGLDLYLFENGYPRSTGYAVFSTASLSATDTSTDYSTWGSYGAAGSGTYEFVSFNGGPHAGFGTNVYIDPDTGEAHYREKANLYDLSKDRECNLKIGGNDGNTVEFWLKKAAFNPAATQTEVVFDIFTTSSISSSLDYGRMTIEMSGHGAATNTLSPFYITYMSGTSGISKENIGSSLTTSSVADDNWHHYSFRFKNDGSNTAVDLFVDGGYNHTIKTGTTVDYVSGTIVGTIGALATHPSGTNDGSPQAGRGWGKLSGSVDEFRFWKNWRTSKQIQTRWFDQVGGGTNTDDANTHLGLYYKFNEGLTLTASTDAKVLDYSGRISNGSWTGYSSLYSRDTGSAINESGLASYSGVEFRDPIIYSSHPDVVSYLSDRRKEGKQYDYTNPSTIYYTLPGWILEEHDANNPDDEGIIANSLWNLTQIISSYFDSATNFAKSMPSLPQNDYVSGSQKPIPFMNRILQSKGFITPEIFNAIDSLEYFENRDNNIKYTEKFNDVKNIIYKNIYNNLTYINKSKGTEKSFRNLIRCFGIDDQVYKLNIYSNNVDYVLEDNFRTASGKFKLINFNTIPNADASVHQYSSSLNSNSVTFMSASKDFNARTSQEASLPFSVEANITFPNRVDQSNLNTFKHGFASYANQYPIMITASLFGQHTAEDSIPQHTTWNTNDYANFVVKSEKLNTYSDKARFVLTGTAGGFLPELVSSYYDDVYSDTNWSFLVSLYPEAYPNANQVSGTLSDSKASGVNILLSFAGQAQNDRFKINVPVAAGGTGNDITIRILEAATPSAGTANEIQVKGTAPIAVNSTATRLVAAINGSSDTSIIQYGAGSGNATSGIKGITAAIGSTPDDITITANVAGPIGNSITLTDIEGTFVEDGATGASPATLSNGATENTGYVVQFSGISKVLDVTMNQFTLTGSITQQQAINFLASPKRLFVGSHKTNFTGSVLQQSDVKFNTIRAWQNKLTINDLSLHASNPNNYSIKNPEQNAYLFNTSINNVYVPNKETLLLHWNFDNVTGSDTAGSFIVDDFTSGSVEQINRYGFLSNLSNKQHTGIGHEFKASSTDVVLTDDIIIAKQNIPETMASENTVKVLQNDDIYFTRDSRPTFFDLYVEKSPYQNISEDMLNFMSTVVDFNNLIGQGVDRYRGEYKALKMLRQLFFQRTTTPDVDKYIEYFKWFDLAVSSMIQKLAPMSSGLDERPLRNVIESHILERNKYQSKFPTYEFKQSDPEASIFGINEMLYPWKEGHKPLSETEAENCLWAKERAERSALTSGDSIIDSDRQAILNVVNNLNDASAPSFKGSSGTYQGSTYALRRFARPYKINAIKEPEIHGGGNAYENKKVGFWDSLRKRPTAPGATEGALISIEPAESELESFKSCDDNLILNKGKRKYKFSVGVSQDNAESFSEVYKGDLVFPFSLYSSSVVANPAMTDLADFKPELAITNLHHDSYGPFGDVPMQGPFTEKYVGGRAYRHVMTNLVTDNEEPQREGERLEGWRLKVSSTALDLVNVAVENPKSVFFREEYAKRPVNIKNIQQITASSDGTGIDSDSSTNIGNYSKTYEIVMTNGRSLNNRYLAESDGDLATTVTDSLYVSGVVDFALPRRDLTGKNKAIIVNRFSAPGDPATMCEGMLDVAAAEYSVYNALPFRNLSVRLPLQELLSDHTNQFGLFSDARTIADYERASWGTYPGGSSSINDPGANLKYIGTGSFHKVNRNGRKQIKYSNEFTGDFGTVSTETVFDNFFVTHQIPQTDVQYAWITASLINDYTGSALYGFEQPDFSNASLASTDLTFITSSVVGSFVNSSGIRVFGLLELAAASSAEFIPVDFAGLNTNIVNPLTSSANQLGFPNVGEMDSTPPEADLRVYKGGLVDNFSVNVFAPPSRVLQGILSSRGGPVGGSNWKLYRKDNHPIVRTHRGENRLSYLKPQKATNSEGDPIVIDGAKGSITSVIEPPITSKYKQLRHKLSVKLGISSNPEDFTTKGITINHSYLNNLGYFTDHGADGIDLDSDILAERNKKSEQQTLDVINYYLYSAGDFAGVSELNPIDELLSYTVRETVFPKEQNTYLSKVRGRENFENLFWKGDASKDDSQELREEENAVNSIGFTIPKQSIFALDARLNVKSAAANLEGTDGAGELQNNCTVFMNSAGDHFVSPLYTLPVSSSTIGIVNDTAWDAGLQSGLNPSYTTYAEYANEIRTLGKDYSIIPEFRISEYMTDYINTGFDINARNPQINPTKPFLDLTGSSVLDATNPEFYKVYNTTDLLKFFEITEDATDDTVIDRVTMRCKSLIKFLPYDGFYPAQRTTQLANLFSASYLGPFEGNNLTSGSARAGLTPFYAPGIMYNSIKAGLAVDFPMPSNSVNDTRRSVAYVTSSTGTNPFYERTQPFTRIPFEAIIDPDGNIGGNVGSLTWYDLHINDARIANQASGFGTSYAGEKFEGLQSTSQYTFKVSDNQSTLLYTLAANNFFAESINFFLPQGRMTRLTSLPSNHPDFASNTKKLIQPGGESFKEYTMQVRISNSPNFKNENTTFFNYEQGSAYGVPVGTAVDFSAFAPVYKHATLDSKTGAGILTLTYRPLDPDDFTYFDLDEIMNNLTASFQGAQGSAFDQAATKYAQHFTSSFNIGKARILETDFDAITGQPKTVKKDINEIDVMIIEPKWECPMLNFKNVTQSTIASTGDTGRVGMWHQYGEIDEANGAFLSIADPSSVNDTSLTGSLADLLGFDKTNGKVPQRIGKVGSSKEISEAVVAIPFRVVGGNKVTFKISRDAVNQAELILQGNQPGDGTLPENPLADQSIVDMVDKMQRYVIPPHMDFITYKNNVPGKLGIEQIPGGPFAMYIFEFTRTLTQEDLANIWQNLPPVSIGASPFYHDSDEVTISHEVFNSLKLNLINGKKILGNEEQISKSREYTSDIQWMVFKAKKRAATNYFERTTNINDGGQFDFKFANQQQFPNITYNWPYDFFSMVELVKLDAEITMTPQDGSVKVPTQEIQEKFGAPSKSDADQNEYAPLPETPASALPGVGAGGTTDFIDPSGPGGFGSSTGAGVSTPDGGPSTTVDSATAVGQSLAQLGNLGGSDPFGQ